MVILRFAPLDYAVLVAFVLGTLALGFSAKLRNLSILQYLAAGRSLTLPVFVASLVSTWYGGILGIGESVTYFGVGTWVLLGLPYYCFALLYALKLAKRVRGAVELSIPERLEQRFGKGVALIGAVLIFLLAVPAAHALMLGTLLQSLTNWSLLPSMLVAVLVGIAFLYRGGLLADARVSLLSFVMMYVGFLAIVGWCAFRFPLWEPLRQLNNPSLLQWDGGSGVPYVISFFLLGAWTLVDPAFHQRVASAESPEVGRRGVLVCILFWMLFDTLSISAGLYGLTLVHLAPDQSPVMLFPLLAEAALPPGLKALFFCGMLGTILTAFVGYTLVAGASLGRDIGARWKDIDDVRVTQWSRAGLFVAAAIAVALALGVRSVVGLWYAWAGAVVGAILIPTLQAYGLRFAPNARSLWVGASIAISFAASVGWFVYGKNTQNELLEAGILRTGGAWSFVLPDNPRWSEAVRFSVGTLLPGLLISALLLLTGEIYARIRRNQWSTKT